MLSTKTIPVALALFLTTLILTACGGGGGGEDPTSSTPTTDGGENPTTAVPTTGVSITTSNAKLVSAATLDSVDTVLSASTGVDILFGVSVQPSESDFNYADFIVRQLKNILAQNSLTGNSLTGASVSDTVDCATGNYTLTGTISNQGTLTAEDFLDLSFNNCLDLGVTVNGTMSITITEVSDGFNSFTLPYSFSFDVALSNLSVNDSGLVVTGNGDISMVLAEDGTNSTMQLSGTSLSASWGSQREILTNYAYVISQNTTGAYSLTLAGALASDKINGSVSFTTITALTSNENQSSGNPTAGQVHITTSADSSQAWLIALEDGTNVQIDVDTNGDNVVDDTVMTTWTELQSL